MTTLLTPCLVVRNEEYFISYVIAPLVWEFPNVVMIDTGSTDETVNIARQTANAIRKGRLSIIQKNLKDEAVRIGDAKNHLMNVLATPYMFLVDGDEIWPRDQIQIVKKYVETIDPNLECCMVTGRNVFPNKDNSLFESLDGNMSSDRVFRKDVRWVELEYPFEGHDLDGKVKRGVVGQIPAYYWHTRHLLRSSKEQDAYFRDKKRSYYKPAGERVPIPRNWMGQKVLTFPNPYEE